MVENVVLEYGSYGNSIYDEIWFRYGGEVYVCEMPLYLGENSYDIRGIKKTYSYLMYDWIEDKFIFVELKRKIDISKFKYSWIDTIYAMREYGEIDELDDYTTDIMIDKYVVDFEFYELIVDFDVDVDYNEALGILFDSEDCKKFEEEYGEKYEELYG